MVVLVESEAPDEVSCTASAQMEPTKYIIVQNHVRELTVTTQEKTKDKTPRDKMQAAETHKKKRKKLSKITYQASQTTSEKHTDLCVTQTVKSTNKKPADVSVPETEESTGEKLENISASDLEELRTVYKKCKEVINRIESKYGHFLGLDGESSSSWDKKSSDDYEAKCTCRKNKKIVFDDAGQQFQETVLENHICPKKLKRRHSDIEGRTLDIQYEEPAALPEDLQSLGLILKDSSINKSYRHKVINKVKSIRLDHSNNIRFDKQSLIEKLKTNPDMILDFKGTNFSDLPGYPDKK